MSSVSTSRIPVKVFDRVEVDGRHGTAIGFYAREERSVLILLDDSGLIEVAEPRVVIEPSATSDCSETRRSDEIAGRVRHSALTQRSDPSVSRVSW
jgi:hypothetical protein